MFTQLPGKILEDFSGYISAIHGAFYLDEACHLSATLVVIVIFEASFIQVFKLLELGIRYSYYHYLARVVRKLNNQLLCIIYIKDWSCNQD